MQKKYDAVVIGSGFGGGTLALRLAQSGYHVCVLERGRRWRGKNLIVAPTDLPSSTFPELGDRDFFWGRQLWRPARQRLGLYDMRQLTNLQGLVGAGVGGGSLIWANVVVQAPEDVFRQGWPQGINLETLQRYYRLADPYLGAKLVPGLPGARPDSAKRTIARAQLLRQAAEKNGANWKPVQVAVNFGSEGHPMSSGHGASRQMGCNFCGLCTAGCPQNAKNTVDLTYISAAEALGAEVFPQHVVSDLEPLGNAGRDGWRVHFRRYDDEGRLAESGSVECGKVVVAAGAFGSTELLLRAKRKGSLRDLSDALGSHFSFNGNVLSGALAPGGAGDTNNGPAIASMADFGKFVVEDISNPIWAAGIVGSSSIGRIASFALSMAGHKPKQKTLERKAKDLLVYVGVGRDSASGQLRINPFGMLKLSWPGGIKNEPIVAELHTAMKAMAESLGRKYVPNVFSIFNRPVTYHPLGGCPMADSAEQGVVDADGRVFGYENLFVADGSIVPTAIGRNPSYTIAALAERVAEGITSGGSSR